MKTSKNREFMYKLPASGQISFRVSKEEREILQSLADQLQTEKETEFKNASDIVFALLDEYQTLSAIVEEQESKIESLQTESTGLLAELQQVDKSKENDLLLPLFEAIKEKMYGKDDIAAPETNELILADVLEVLNQPDPQPQIITKEVEKLVERELSADELILKLSEKQIELLKLIANWRFSKKLDAEKRTPAQVIEGITFNKPALLNWGEGFRTGIKRKNLN